MLVFLMYLILMTITFIKNITIKMVLNLISMFQCGEGLLKLGFFFILISAYLFLVQQVGLSQYLNTLRLSKKNLKQSRSHIDSPMGYKNCDVNRLFLVPLYLAHLTFIWFIINYGNSHHVYSIHFDPSFLPFPAVETFLSFQLDTTSACFLAPTIMIGSIVNTFVPLYMRNEPEERRFVVLLNFFLFSMIFLILSANLLVFFLFWELIGVFSYFLINFWIHKSSTFKSATKAFVYNQFSDGMLALAIVQYYYWFGTFQFPTQNTLALVCCESESSPTKLLLPFFLAASCKSVQFFYHFWLPDSMDAPVPASALIHSATLVAAGIVLIIRIKPILIINTLVPTIFSYIALITIIVGGLSATNQSDLKKILAYSTISNCGYMMFLAINSTNWALFTFFSAHGLLKAISFIFVGFIILIIDHKQDYKYAGNLANFYKLLFVGTSVSVLSLGALPFTTMLTLKHGLFSLTTNTLTDVFLTQITFLIGSLASLIYSIKLVFLVFCSFGSKLSIRANKIPTQPHNHADLIRYWFTDAVSNKILVKVCVAALQTIVLILLYTFIYSKGGETIFIWENLSLQTANLDKQLYLLDFFNVNGYRSVVKLWDHNILRLVGLLQVISVLCIALPMWSGKASRGLVMGSWLVWVLTLTNLCI